MYHNGGYEWIIWILSLLSIMLLGSLWGNSSKTKFRGKIDLVKKICMGVFVITSMYWIITFPYVSSYYDFSDKSEYPSIINSEQQSDYILKNLRRIEILERELKETKDELSAVHGRIRLFLELLMYGLIYFCVSWIFTPKKNMSEDD